MAVLWSGTIFLSAFLLFLVQPMMAKMILPMLGGTPAVWNTCMLFYQTTLLGGYGYVHVLNRKLQPGFQVPVHLVVLALPLFLLPIGLPKGWTPPDQSTPILWVLLMLTVSIGLPFFTLSTTAPLLQRWFSWTKHPSANDPYFLYAASNAGSMVALLGYPFVIEPRIPLKGQVLLAQTSLWSAGYAGLVAMIFCCAWVLRRNQDPSVTPSIPTPHAAASISAAPLPLKQLLRWVALACIPSSMLLGATTYITLNVAAIPLLWVLPLALYLLSFILVFAKWPPLAHRAMVLALPVVLLVMVFDAMPAAPLLPKEIRLLLPVLGLGAVAMVCHGELARTRPPAERLTLFYLLMSVGGALGGLFNALIAPVIFRDIYEYQASMVGAALLLPRLEDLQGAQAGAWLRTMAAGKAEWLREALWPATAVVATLLTGWITFSLGEAPFLVDAALAAIPLALCYACSNRPLQFGAMVGVVLVSAHVIGETFSDTKLHQSRTFFGVLKVMAEGDLHRLKHGTVNHGMQNMKEGARRDSLSYFHPTGSYGQVFAAFTGAQAKKRIAVTGLGIAALANYCDAGQQVTYYEIDPEVTAIAQNPRWFSYFRDSVARGVDLQVVHGDARLKMEEAADAAYDMIILDAFTSDAIPVHLLTREAIELYLRKLAPDGLLVVHISNKYLALEPVLGNLAETLNLSGLKQFGVSDDAIHRFAADIVLLAREKEAFGSLGTDPRWTPLQRVPSVGIWSDDFSNVAQIIKWNNEVR
ncbi:MAG: fused MFS/spermidine synthase [Nitrospira sp.]|nr:fused MFS/spermidine synthase [Nitrospira sp.]